VSISSIQSSRRRAAYDSCRILRTLVLDATPRKDAAEAISFLYRAHLEDCRHYANRTVNGR
jgi:hypothetical protein